MNTAHIAAQNADPIENTEEIQNSDGMAPTAAEEAAEATTTTKPASAEANPTEPSGDPLSGGEEPAAA